MHSINKDKDLVNVGTALDSAVEAAISLADPKGFVKVEDYLEVVRLLDAAQQVLVAASFGIPSNEQEIVTIVDQLRVRLVTMFGKRKARALFRVWAVALEPLAHEVGLN